MLPCHISILKRVSVLFSHFFYDFLYFYLEYLPLTPVGPRLCLCPDEGKGSTEENPIKDSTPLSRRVRRWGLLIDKRDHNVTNHSKIRSFFFPFIYSPTPSFSRIEPQSCDYLSSRTIITQIRNVEPTDLNFS